MRKIKFIKRNSCDGRYANSLDVRFTKACDNNCPFCIEKCGIKSLGKTNVEELIHSTIISKKKDILILGGEPLLLIPEVLQYVKGIRKSVNHIYITTSLPATINANSRDFAEIMDLIDGLNISLQHFNSEENNKILHATNKHNRIELLHSLCTTRDWTDKIRVSINLVKRAIDSSLKDIVKF